MIIVRTKLIVLTFLLFAQACDDDYRPVPQVHYVGSTNFLLSSLSGEEVSVVGTLVIDDLQPQIYATDVNPGIAHEPVQLVIPSRELSEAASNCEGVEVVATGIVEVLNHTITIHVSSLIAMNELDKWKSKKCFWPPL